MPTVLSAAAFLPVALTNGRSRRIGIALTLLPWLAGAGLQQVDWVHPAGPARTATIVQGGISQDRKWLAEQRPLTLDLYRQSLGSHADSDLVVWPEVALPYTIDQVESYLDALQEELAAAEQALLLGILERDGELVYNSLLMLGGEQRQFYRKRHLVPFGEFFPVPDFVREWMRLMSLPHSDMTPGAPEQALLSMPDGTKLAAVICYEDAYGAEQLFAFPAAELLINVSNDAWFGDSIAPHQHLQIARVRAREVGRFVVRATNNGISAFIGPRGELLRTAPQFRYATLTMEVVPMAGATPYSVVGNWPVITTAFLLLGWCARHRRS
jgi:apolipoprotein N-acyltransferase